MWGRFRSPSIPTMLLVFTEPSVFKISFIWCSLVADGVRYKDPTMSDSVPERGLLLLRSLAGLHVWSGWLLWRQELLHIRLPRPYPCDRRCMWVGISLYCLLDPAGNRTTRRPDHRKETQTAVICPCLPLTKSGKYHLASHSERGKKIRQTEEEVGRQRQGMNRPGVRQVTEGSEKQRKMEKTSCEIICGAPTTLAVKG